MNAKDEVYFMYSQQQIDTDTEINARIGRKFIPGDVSIGNNRAKYSKILLTSDLDKMIAMYPDAKIVTKGIYGNMKFTKIDDSFVR